MADTAEVCSMTLHQLESRLLLQGEHCYLDPSDECYFADEYVSCDRQGLRAQILSLKRGSKPAIRSLAEQLGAVLPDSWTRTCTFVAMPSSAGNANPVRSMLIQLPAGRDIREL